MKSYRTSTRRAPRAAALSPEREARSPRRWRDGEWRLPSGEKLAEFAFSAGSFGPRPALSPKAPGREWAP